jgi:uncharacterized protein YuzE
MENILVIFDKEGNTLDIWFGKPRKAFVCEETGEEIILKKNKKGRVIGIEMLNVAPLNKIIKKGPIKVVVK